MKKQHYGPTMRNITALYSLTTDYKSMIGICHGSETQHEQHHETVITTETDGRFMSISQSVLSN